MANMKMGLHLERAQIRSRQLQSQVVAMHDQIRSLKEENLRHHHSQLDKCKEVSDLQEQLKKERDRLQRLAVQVSNYRRKEESLKNNPLKSHFDNNDDAEKNNTLANHIRVTPLTKPTTTTSSSVPRGNPMRSNEAELGRILIDLGHGGKVNVVGLRGDSVASSTIDNCWSLIPLLRDFLSYMESTNSSSLERIEMEGREKHSLGVSEEEEEEEELIKSEGFYVTAPRHSPGSSIGTHSELKSTSFFVTAPRENIDIRRNPVVLGRSSTNPPIKELFKALELLQKENARLSEAFVRDKEKEIWSLQNELREKKESVSSRGGSGHNCVDPIQYLDSVREMEGSIAKMESDLNRMNEDHECTLLQVRRAEEELDVGKDGVFNVSSGQELRKMVERLTRDIASLRKQNQKLLKMQQVQHQPGQRMPVKSEMMPYRRRPNSHQSSKTQDSFMQIKELEHITTGLKKELEDLRLLNSRLMLTLKEAKVVISRRGRLK